MKRLALAALLLTITATSAWSQHPQIATPSSFPTSAISANRPTMAPILAARDAGTPMEIRRRRILGGHEFGWLKPRFSNNVSAVITRPSGREARSFDHDHELNSRVWLGVENNCCNGIRARYWYFDADSPTQVNFATAANAPISLTIQGAGGNFSRTATANVGDAMTSNHHLEMRTIDLEATHRLPFARGDALAAFGLRYAKIHQRAHAVATDPGGSLTELVCQDLDFQGFGPTLSGEMTLQACRFDFARSALSCYAGARTSLLFGQQEQEIVLVTGGGTTLQEDLHVQDDFLPVIEMSGGLQWMACPRGRLVWIARSGYRAESWLSAGGPVDVDSNIAVSGIHLSVAAIF
ncbi:MAG: hypothetical protein HKN47_00520 [Pirellulaceae bacterium]|nr:hypothetical protein [Pirellulaceae bacterium]